MFISKIKQNSKVFFRLKTDKKNELNNLKIITSRILKN